MLKLILTLALVYSVSAQCPRIIPRGGWNARDMTRNLPVLAIRPAPFLIVHPTGTRSCTTQADCSAVIRDIQDFQIQVNAWQDISYHFIIDTEGRIYQGRGWGRTGVNVQPFDNQAINIGIIGQFRGNDQITQAQTASLEHLMECGMSERALDIDVQVFAQCQTALGITGCDQNNVFEFVSALPRFIETPRPV